MLLDVWVIRNRNSQDIEEKKWDDVIPEPSQNELMLYENAKTEEHESQTLRELLLLFMSTDTQKRIKCRVWRATSTVPMDWFNAENLCIEENEDGAQEDDKVPEENVGKLELCDLSKADFGYRHEQKCKNNWSDIVRIIKSVNEWSS